MSGLSTIGSISFGIALVAGRKRVPNPATGKTALRTGLCIKSPISFGRELLPHCPPAGKPASPQVTDISPKIPIRTSEARLASPEADGFGFERTRWRGNLGSIGEREDGEQ